MMKREDYLKLVDKNSKTLMDMFMDAHAVHASVNQLYDGTIPYSYHLDQVGGVALKYGDLIVKDENDLKAMVFAAYFHDSIEDARLTYNDVVKKAKAYMDDETAVLAAELVYALTNEKGKNRAERESDKYFEDMKKIYGAPYLKFCDRIANMRHARMTKSSLFKKYKQELPGFIARIGDYVPEEMLDELKAIAGD
jgi:(p)ppGpp synthase/HD superfamily hydrolase